MGFMSCRQIPHWQEVLKGVPKVIPPPFCPASQCQLGFGCGESPWQCPRRRPCLAMPVENRSAGTPSHCLSALELQLVTSTVPIGKRGSKEGKSVRCELQSGAEEPSRSIPGAPRTADLSCWLQEAHGGVPKAEQAGTVDTHVLGCAWAGSSGSQLGTAHLWDRDTWATVSVAGRLPVRSVCLGPPPVPPVRALWDEEALLVWLRFHAVFVFLLGVGLSALNNLNVLGRSSGGFNTFSVSAACLCTGLVFPVLH